MTITMSATDLVERIVAESGVPRASWDIQAERVAVAALNVAKRLVLEHGQVVIRGEGEHHAR